MLASPIGFFWLGQRSRTWWWLDAMLGGASRLWCPGGLWLGTRGASYRDGEGQGPVKGLHGRQLLVDKVRVPSALGHIPGPKKGVEEQAGRECSSLLSGAFLIGQ